MTWRPQMNLTSKLYNGLRDKFNESEALETLMHQLLDLPEQQITEFIQSLEWTHMPLVSVSKRDSPNWAVWFVLDSIDLTDKDQSITYRKIYRVIWEILNQVRPTAITIDTDSTLQLIVSDWIYGTADGHKCSYGLNYSKPMEMTELVDDELHITKLYKPTLQVSLREPLNQIT